ncbi:minichromosome maintenance protein 5 [Castilleja foliolosa]|uniref:Minichromosome maintenance protein 5 n=1 Tax=Castilleja foliolosa TaxID=1961234 RepID=A0ABD3ENN5_9LAMI
MSGWDEGGVYYSDEAQFPVVGGGDQSEAANRHAALQKFKEFIRTPARQSRRPHLLRSRPNPPSVSPPEPCLPLFETAAAQVLVGLKSRVAGETGEMEEPVPGEVQILLKSEQDSASIRSLRLAQYISKLVKVSGIVIAASRTKAKATNVTLLCKNCKNVKLVPCRPGLGGAMVPRSCDHIAQVLIDGKTRIEYDRALRHHHHHRSWVIYLHG